MNKRILSVVLLLTLSSLVYSANIIILNPGCRQFDSNGNCLACSNRFYKNKEGICQPVNNNCRTFNPDNGACTSCYDGFSIVQNACLPKFQDQTGVTNCNELGQNGTCKKCSNGYYFDINRECKKIPDTCSNFNINTGRCQGCYQGYALDLNYQCVISTQQVDDLGCNRFQNGKCVKCSVGFYFNADKKCIPVPSTCLNFDTVRGICQECYPGYRLDASKNCIEAAPEDIDQGCAKFENGKCTKCSIGFYFTKNGKCNIIPTTCSNFNTVTQKCLGCYEGYALDLTGACVVSVSGPSDVGCTKFQNGVCTKCSFGFYFDKLKNCKAVPSTCANYDTSNQICLSCYPGYSLDAGKCVVSDAGQGDQGCNTFQNGKCIKCSVGYYFDKSNNCKQIPTTCSNFNTKTEQCLSCYPGYDLKSGKCVVSQGSQGDQGCNTFKDGKCTKCSFGYYFDKKKNCKQIPTTCGNFDTTKQQCLSCYPGFILQKGVCNINNSTSSTDIGCNSFQNGKCVKCSYGYYFDKKNVCKQIPATCRDFDVKKEVCLACYPGYVLDKNKVCIQEVGKVSDLGCAKFQNGKCTKCSFGFYFNRVSVCKAIPTTCSSFDSVKQQCLACYPGYSLTKTKQCMQSAPVVGDQGCNRFQQGKCISCSTGYYFNTKGICTQIPSTCSDFDILNLQCRACYPGYQLNAKKQCVVAQSASIDVNCKEFRNGKCVQCSFGAYFDATGRCTIYDPLCKRFNVNTKICEECYPGFTIDNTKKICIEAPMQAIDQNCKTIKNGTCTQCSYRFYKDKQGRCTSVDPTCKNYNAITGQCYECYDGYKLNGQKCQKQDLTNVTDTNCAQFKDGKCVKCSFGSFFNRNGICQSVDPLCQTWNQVNGDCQSCYPSFQVSNGKCVPSKNDKLDPNCSKFNNNQCVQCSRGFYFNPTKVCTQIDPLCSTFDSKSSQCFSCYTGYKIQNGKCIQDIQSISDQNCAQFINSKCTKCSYGFYFDNNNLCKGINPQCKYFDEKNKRCGDCYPGYVLVSGDCVVGTKDNLCAESKDGICLRCVPRAYFNDQGLCSQVSQYCNQYNPFDGDCQSCYGGFQLIRGQCKPQKQSNGCIEYSKDNICLSCQKRRYLSNNQCLKIDDFCQQFNFFKKQCTRCYSGYQVVNNRCIVAQVKKQQQIQNCFTYNIDGKCVECFDRYYLSNNMCKEVNVFCKKYNFNTGDCTDCYTGFVLKGVNCVRK